MTVFLFVYQAVFQLLRVQLLRHLAIVAVDVCLLRLLPLLDVRQSDVLVTFDMPSSGDFTLLTGDYCLIMMETGVSKLI